MIHSDGKQKEAKPRRLDPPIINALYLLVLLLTLLVPGCSSVTQDSLTDRSFLTGEPCEPPCWYGLRIDQSTKEDVYAIVKGLGFIDQQSLRESDRIWLDLNKSATYIEWGCLHPLQAQCGEAIVYQDKLKELWLSVEYDVTFETVVQKLGTPDYVWYDYIFPADTLVVLNWPEKRVAVRYSQRYDDTLYRSLKSGKRLPRGAKVTRIDYSAREVFDLRNCCTRIPWPGFE